MDNQPAGQPAKRVLIVSAEVSSALYAQRLLQHWQKSNVKVEAFGVGDHAMVDLGFKAVGRAEEMAVVGFKEVIKHYPMIKSVFEGLLAECDRQKPDFALLLDYPDFNFRLAKELKKRGIRVVYYISPQLWAWRKGRLKLVQKYIDKMLVLFPFEKDFYEKNGVSVNFVGHPLLDELAGMKDSADKFVELRQRLGVGSDDLLVGLLPGSRKSEIEQHLGVMVRTCEKLHAKYPALKFALLLAPGMNSQWLKAQLPKYDFPLVFLQDDPVRMAGMLDMAICASGTATLVLGLLGCPMVVIYKMKAFSAWLAKLFVKGVSHFAMVNLIFNRRVVPELFQSEVTEEAIVAQLTPWIENSQARHEKRTELLDLRNRLGQAGATVRVAEALREWVQ